MAARMDYNASGASAQLRLGATNTIELKTVQAARVPLTGVRYGSAVEVYGGQTISTIPMGSNATISMAAPAW